MIDTPMTPEREKHEEWRENYQVILDAILVEIELRREAEAECERLKARVEELKERILAMTFGENESSER